MRQALTYQDAARLAREYMDTEDAARRTAILQQVAGWSDRLDELAMALRPVPPADAPTGRLPEDQFTTARIRANLARILPRPEGPVLPYVPTKGSVLKGPAPGEEHLNWVYVPENYDPKRPVGLIIGLHGGAGSNAQSAAGDYLEKFEDLMHWEDFVVVCPSAPPLVYRWGSSKFKHPESEIHLQSVIEEYSTRYAIDPNRVYLMGFSMGGIGSWWHAFRHGDRFALIAPMGGGWTAAYWPKLHGVMICMSNGAFDYHACFADFARCAHARMRALDIAHVRP